jgi:hypothetical protein
MGQLRSCGRWTVQTNGGESVFKESGVNSCVRSPDLCSGEHEKILKTDLRKAHLCHVALRQRLRGKRFKVCCVVLCFLVGSSTDPAIFAEGNADSIHTTAVTPLVGEDIARPFKYEMGIPSSGKKIRAVFVVFERGPGLVRWRPQKASAWRKWSSCKYS